MPQEFILGQKWEPDLGENPENNTSMVIIVEPKKYPVSRQRMGAVSKEKNDLLNP